MIAAILYGGNGFRDDREGSVAIMFALALVPTMIAVGAGIDYGRAVSERSMLQSGVDAGALAGIQQVRRGLAVADATTTIKQVVAANDANTAAGVTQVSLSTDGTTLCVKAVSSVPTTLMAISGYKTISVGAYACSSMRLDTYEIAFAIDNSASMANSAQSGGKTKMQYAQQAAVAMIAALAPNASTGSAGVPATYSVVPFSSSVNVGASNQGAAWLDNKGQSSIHWKSFSYVPSSAQGYSLWTVLGLMSASWGGCVEERPYPYTTSDDAPSSSTPDTLFTPFFSPDEVDTNPNGSKYNSLTFNNYTGDTSGSCQSGDAYAVADAKYGRGDGQTKLCKYTSAPTTSGNKYYVTGQAAGPNAGCATPALTPLDNTQSTSAKPSPAVAAINAMSPIGDTALAPGFLWAWRTLSPNQAFAKVGAAAGTSTVGAQQPMPYGYVDPKTTAVNHKVVILLTDGMNDWFGQTGDGFTQYTQYDPNKMVYNAFGYPQEGRLANVAPAGATTVDTARGSARQTTLNACTAAKATKDASGKAAPVEVYTVGFVATDGIDAQGRTLLASCATDTGHAFIAADGDGLVAVFQQIAAAISAPRIQK